MENNLQKIRWEKDLSVNQLSQLSGVSTSEITNIENNRIKVFNIKLITAYRLSKALCVQVWDLFRLE